MDRREFDKGLDPEPSDILSLEARQSDVPRAKRVVSGMINPDVDPYKPMK